MTQTALPATTFDYEEIEPEHRERLQALAEAGRNRVRRTREELDVLLDILTEARPLVPYGYWGKWLRDELGIGSLQHAWNIMHPKLTEPETSNNVSLPQSLTDAARDKDFTSDFEEDESNVVDDKPVPDRQNGYHPEPQIEEPDEPAHKKTYHGGSYHPTYLYKDGTRHSYPEGFNKHSTPSGVMTTRQTDQDEFILMMKFPDNELKVTPPLTAEQWEEVGKLAQTVIDYFQVAGIKVQRYHR